MSLDSLLWSAVGGHRCKDDNSNHANTGADDELKFLFVGGKGGVGKTTSSSAIATLLATHCRKRVLLVSTDPAHSLSDAFRSTFTNQPSQVLPNLHVMEVNPSDTMKKELEKWAQIASDMDGGGGKDGKEDSSLVQKIHGFQDWLAGIPGIDEATALASAIEWIESGSFDIIVFDTAPTGHTLKLLQMPDILQQGIERLQGWQSTLWGYWEMFKGITGRSTASAGSKKRLDAKTRVATMLQDYKRSIEKVALMLRDEKRTRFVVVCIAEYLSISETRRLLQELKKNRVRASHVIVNQLVIQNALSKDELAELESLAEVGSLHLNKSLLEKTVHANRLTTARKVIQEKYLSQLKTFEEVQDLAAVDGGGAVCEMPLLPEEVTGAEALQRFGNLMVRNPPDISTEKLFRDAPTTKPMNKEKTALSSNNKKRAVDTSEWVPQPGDAVILTGLTKSAQYNGIEGMVTSGVDPETGRYGVRVVVNGDDKKLALQRKNIIAASEKNKKCKQVDTGENMSGTESGSGAPGAVKDNLVTDENVSKAKKILQDPEIKSMIEKNPRFADAVQDVMANPMNFMKYLTDPEMSPLIQKALSKLQQ